MEIPQTKMTNELLDLSLMKQSLSNEFRRLIPVKRVKSRRMLPPLGITSPKIIEGIVTSREIKNRLRITVGVCIIEKRS